MKEGKNLAKKYELQEFELKNIPNCDVCLAFHFAPFIDLESFEKECKRLNLPISVECKDENQKGLVIIRCDSMDLIQNLKQVQNSLREPIKKAIRDTNFESEINEALSKTNYFKAVINYLQARHKELHENKVSKEDVAKDIYLKYGHIYGKEGSKKVANLFNKDKEQIISNYLNLQDYMMKHFAIEFFIQQQVEQGYFLMIDITDKSKLISGSDLTISDLGFIPFEKKSITLPSEGKIDNVYYSDKLKNVLITVNPTKKNEHYNYAMLRLKKVNTAILFINFLFQKQSEGVKASLENFDLEAERIRSAVLSYDVKGIDATFKGLVNLENIIFAYLDEFLMPIKKFIDEIAPKAKKIETEIIDDIFNKDVKFGSIVGKSKFQPPNWFIVTCLVENLSL